MADKPPTIDEIMKEYGARIDEQIATAPEVSSNFSKSYLKFKSEMAPELSRYERWCRSLGNVIRLKVAEKNRKRVEKDLAVAHVDVSAEQALTLSMMSFVSVFFLGIIVSVAIAMINASPSSGLIGGMISGFPVLFFLLVTVLAVFLFYFVNAYPQRLANKWRLKASSQMVPAILYIVVYMRHTPNLEKAVAFAAEHLQPPLSLDFRKVFYDVEIGKFSSIKESIDNYLEIWRGQATEFIEAFQLIESSLFEPNDNRRITVLEKSLQVVLEGVYDKMLRFVHDVRSPLTNIYMLAVVLPVLGIALLPLASAMVGGMLKWVHVVILYNLILPFIAFYLTDKILFLRPGGYGETGLLERNPHYEKYKSKGPYVFAFLLCLPFLIIGFLPLLFQFTPIAEWIGTSQDFAFSEIGLSFLGDGNFFDFKSSGSSVFGPFGIGALVCGMFIPLGLALFFAMAFRDRTKELIKERNKTRQLESEFNNSLFQLGNRLGNGVPPELVFGKVAQSSRGLMTEDFFRRVHYNIAQMGMDVESAIFNSSRGALIFFPSELIATSMRVLVEASKKGLKIAAISLMSISEYIKNIKKITDRLRDLLAEVISDMKSNMTFLAPLLSGVVVGLAAMITSILNSLDLASLSSDGLSTAGNLDAFVGADGLFQVINIIPPYYLQIAIGIYLIEIIFILTGTLVTIDSGQDRLEKTNKTGRNLTKGILIYLITAFASTMALFVLAAIVLSGL